MNIDNIKVGQEFKNYRELCDALEIEVKAGNSKKAQLKDLERYILMEKDPKKKPFTVKEIYSHVKMKEENQRNTAEYIKLSEILLMQLLLANKGEPLVVSNTELAKRLNFIQQDFIEFYGARGRLKKLLDINYETINDFMDATNNAYKNAISTILNSLQRNMAIIYEIRWLVIDIEDDQYYRFATIEEKQAIIEIRHRVLKEHYYGDIKRVRVKNLMQQYYAHVDAVLKDELQLLRCYQVYEIVFTKDAVEEEYLKRLKAIEKLDRDEILSLSAKVNSQFADRNIKNAKVRHDNAKNIVKENGYINSSNRIKSRSDFNYVKDITELTDKLIKDILVER